MLNKSIPNNSMTEYLPFEEFLDKYVYSTFYNYNYTAQSLREDQPLREERSKQLFIVIPPARKMTKLLQIVIKSVSFVF